MNWEVWTKCPTMWKGWKSVATFYGRARKQAGKDAKKLIRCYEGCKVYKITKLTE